MNDTSPGTQATNALGAHRGHRARLRRPANGGRVRASGISCIGLDVDTSKSRHGHAWSQSRLERRPTPRLPSLRADGRLIASTDPRVLDTADVAVICVPTPLTIDGGPDLRFVETAGATIGRASASRHAGGAAEHVRPGHDHRNAAAAARGCQRICAPAKTSTSSLHPSGSIPATRASRSRTRPRSSAASRPNRRASAACCIEACIDEVVPVSSPEIAELAKLVENTFRFINISFINEMALLCDRLGVNVWEVIEAAKTKPFAFMAALSKPGRWRALHPSCAAVFAGRGAANMVCSASLSRRPIASTTRCRNWSSTSSSERCDSGSVSHWSDANVLLVGVTYKPDIADIRESAAIRVLEERSVPRRAREPTTIR